MNELKTGATDMNMTLMPSKTHFTQRTDKVYPLDELSAGASGILLILDNVDI